MFNKKQLRAISFLIATLVLLFPLGQKAFAYYQISVSPMSHNFGSTHNLTIKTGPDVTVTNTGTCLVNGGTWDYYPSFYLSGGTHSDSFYSCAYNLEPGKSTKCSFSFIPSITGDHLEDICFEPERLKGCTNLRAVGVSLPWEVSLTASPSTNVEANANVTITANTSFSGMNSTTTKKSFYLVVRIYEGTTKRCEGYSSSGSMSCSYTTSDINKTRTFKAVVERVDQKYTQAEKSISIKWKDISLFPPTVITKPAINTY